VPGGLVTNQTGDNKTRTATGPVLLEAFQGFINQQTVMQWGKQAYGPGENGGITGIVYYSTTRAENDPAFGAAEPWEPGIPRVQVNLYQDDLDNATGLPGPDGEIDDINAPAGVQLADVDNAPFGWSEGGLQGPEDIERSGVAGYDLGDALEAAHTDSWDDNQPTGCQGEVYLFDPDGAGPMTASPKDCFDGLRNFNQVREGVFDGYAFGRPATDGPRRHRQAVPPPGYEIVKEQDKNVDFGEATPSTLPPTCVNWDDRRATAARRPAELDLFPWSSIAETLADGDPARQAYTVRPRSRCDSNGQNAAGRLLLHQGADRRSHLASSRRHRQRVRPQRPNRREVRAAVLPISIRDWMGREIGRTYSDQYGVYNVLVPSTYTANQPKPSGMVPNMITVCLNSPKKPDPANPGQFIEPLCSTASSATFKRRLPPTSHAGGAGRSAADPGQFRSTAVPDHAPRSSGSTVRQPTVGNPYVDVSGGAPIITITSGHSGRRRTRRSTARPQTVTRDYGFGNDSTKPPAVIARRHA
jgi:hypothetical protein